MALRQRPQAGIERRGKRSAARHCPYHDREFEFYPRDPRLGIELLIRYFEERIVRQMDMFQPRAVAAYCRSEACIEVEFLAVFDG